MARKKKHAAHENHERWLVSYADFITLLFAFFVVMFASSQTDKGKAQQVSDSVNRALDENKIATAIAGILGGTPDDKGKGNAQMKGPGGMQVPVVKPGSSGTDPRIQELLPSVAILKEQLRREIEKGMLEVSLEPRGLTVSLRQAAFFPSGQDTIEIGTLPIFQKLAEAIKRLPNKVRLEGHTDSDPIRNARFRSNWELSAARAVALLELFTERYSIDPRRLSVAGYADTVPIAPNQSSEGKARNRRVDVVILNEFGMHGEPQSPDDEKPPPSGNTSTVTKAGEAAKPSSASRPVPKIQPGAAPPSQAAAGRH